MFKKLKTYLPNNGKNWALAQKTAPGYLVPMSSLFQIIGGKTWSISFIRHGEIGKVAQKADKFWEQS